MPAIKEGNLTFSFEFGAVKFDDSAFYRRQFVRIQNNIQAVDIVAVDNETAYLIEVKDYTHPDTENLTLKELIRTIISKILLTLSAILPMKNNANVRAEKMIAEKFSRADRISVIFHMELPPPRRTLRQSAFNIQNLQIQLRRKLRSVDPHLKIVSASNSEGLPWRVERR